MENKQQSVALWSLLCFFVPPVSLVLWLVWRKRDKEKDIITILKAGCAGLLVYAFIAIMVIFFYDAFVKILYILLAIACLLFMVTVHELGHYIAGRLLKFKITEFSIGFGLPLFQTTNKRGEKISLRLFPLGGYCAFDGEGDEDNVAKEGSFNSQRPWKRIIVFLAGVTMNFLTAIVFSLILLCSVGYDVVQVADTTAKFSDGYTVSTAGELEKDDVILCVNGTKIDFAFSSTFNELLTKEKNIAEAQVEKGIIANVEDYDVNLTVRRDGKTIDIVEHFIGHKIGTSEKATYALGVSAKAYVFSFWEALARCIPFAFGLAWVVLKALWQLLTFQMALNQIGGTVTTISVMATVTQANPATLLILIPLISANLAVFNLLPFPALDGSHVLFTTIEAIRKKPIDRKIENTIHAVGIIILLLFVVTVDILHFVL